MSDRPLPDATPSELFAARVRAHPHSTALLFGHVRMTYAELDARSERLARHLSALGAGPDRVVALLMERSADLVAAVLAVAKAGGAYAALPSNHPHERLNLMMRQTGARILLTDRISREGDFARDQGARGVHLVAADDAGSWTGGGPDLGPGRPASHPEHLAYVVYTSGSTGAPKGVAVTQRDVAALALDHRWRTPGQERVLLHSPHAFDASTYELWVPLLTGRTVVVAPPGPLGLDALARTITRHGVTCLFLTTALFNLMAETVLPSLSGTLRELWTGGESASPKAMRTAREQLPDTVIMHVYGPTETTTFATCAPVTDVGETVPIGSPMDDTRAYVLDDRLRPAPPGATGELYLAGAGLARGYLSDPAATAERFVADPFAGDGGRMYRTGDLVRRSAAGGLEFVGRADGQVKVRGHRIELGEIDAVLGGHPDVARCAVLAHEDRRGDSHLVGYVVPAGARPDPAALRAHLGAVLPDHMVPTRYVFLPALPLTPNGKIDHHSLRGSTGE
ncbi:amino acid adenylation domain-containing protein [Streptomyces sp. NPDC090022]|uniref:amino acid adenylation domain-containing protein n=1 Tax=Streptomyces sp. NPDC090022 TaxID=3365920 RepID=UPI003803868E